MTKVCKQLGNKVTVTVVSNDKDSAMMTLEQPDNHGGTDVVVVLGREDLQQLSSMLWDVLNTCSIKLPPGKVGQW